MLNQKYFHVFLIKFNYGRFKKQNPQSSMNYTQKEHKRDLENQMD